MCVKIALMTRSANTQPTPGDTCHKRPGEAEGNTDLLSQLPEPLTEFEESKILRNLDF